MVVSFAAGGAEAGDCAARPPYLKVPAAGMIHSF
jgi:hypothetical protein